MKRLLLVSLVLTALVQQAPARTPAAAAQPELIPWSHFQVDGSFRTGRRFTLAADFTQLGREAAIEKLTIALMTGGMRVLTANKELGIVSAEQDVRMSCGKKCTLSVTAVPAGSRACEVKIIFVVPDGCAVGKEGIIKFYKETLDAVGSPYTVR